MLCHLLKGGNVVDLPHLGKRSVVESKHEKGHYLWWSFLGWHDCNTNEDRIIRESLRAADQKQ